MYKLLAILLLVVLAANNVASFSVGPASVARTSSAKTTSSSPFASSTSTTAMNMVRVKVDPNQQQEDKFNPANFKGAMYLGSIGIAVLLPVFLLFAAK